MASGEYGGQRNLGGQSSVIERTMCHHMAAGEFGSIGGEDKLATWVPRFCGDTEKVTRKSLVIVGGAGTTKDMVDWPWGIRTAHAQTAGNGSVSQAHSSAAGCKLDSH